MGSEGTGEPPTTHVHVHTQGTLEKKKKEQLRGDQRRGTAWSALEAQVTHPGPLRTTAFAPCPCPPATDSWWQEVKLPLSASLSAEAF